jgi:hypothetical protein
MIGWTSATQVGAAGGVELGGGELRAHDSAAVPVQAVVVRLPRPRRREQDGLLAWRQREQRQDPRVDERPAWLGGRQAVCEVDADRLRRVVDPARRRRRGLGGRSQQSCRDEVLRFVRGVWADRSDDPPPRERRLGPVALEAVDEEPDRELVLCRHVLELREDRRQRVVPPIDVLDHRLVDRAERRCPGRAGRTATPDVGERHRLEGAAEADLAAGETQRQPQAEHGRDALIRRVEVDDLRAHAVVGLAEDGPPRGIAADPSVRGQHARDGAVANAPGAGTARVPAAGAALLQFAGDEARIVEVRRAVVDRRHVGLELASEVDARKAEIAHVLTCRAPFR